VLRWLFGKGSALVVDGGRQFYGSGFVSIWVSTIDEMYDSDGMFGLSGRSVRFTL